MVLEKTIHDLQAEDLKLETTLQKRQENNERLQKTLSVDQEMLDKIVIENNGYKESISTLRTEVEVKMKVLSQKTEKLNELLEQKKSIEHSVFLH